MTSSEDAGTAPADPPAAEAPTVADLSIGAFSDVPPWLIDPDHASWRRGIDRLRSATAAEVPEMVRRRRLPPGRRFVSVAARLLTGIGGWYVVDRRRARRDAQ